MRPPLTPARVIEVLRDRLPPDWDAIAIRPREARPQEPDLVVRITDPRRTTRAFLVCELKQSVTPRDIPHLRNRLKHQEEEYQYSQAVLVSSYLSPNVRQAVTEAGMGYLDLTGNVKLSLTFPGLYLSDHGADSDPWRGPGRPRESLRGEAAARVVRALVDFSPPLRMRELVALSGSSTGATYRAIEYLEEENLLSRDQARKVVDVKWPKLLRAWSRDYEFQGTNRVSTWIAPRGIEWLLGPMASIANDFRYALTGSLAASTWAPYAQPRVAAIYVNDVEGFADACGLRPVSTGANVLLAEPEYGVVFDRSLIADHLGGCIVAAPSQVAVDLLTGPGRNPSEGEELIEWMVKNEQSWRK